MKLISKLFLIAIISGCASKEFPKPPCDYEGVLLEGGDVFFKPYPKGCPGETYRVPNKIAAGFLVITPIGKELTEMYLVDVKEYVENRCKGWLVNEVTQ